MAADTVYEYTLQDLRGLIRILEPTLPYSLTLFRRLQLAPKMQETAVFSNIAPGCSSCSLPSRFTVGVLERNSPGTHGWVFSSIQMQEPVGETTQSSRTRETEMDEEAARNQLIAILREFRSHSARVRNNASHEEDVILLGSVHSRVAELLRAHAEHHVPGLIPNEMRRPGSRRYGKYVYRAGNAKTASGEELPTNLHFDSIRASDHELIIANNSLIQNSHSILYFPYGVGIRSAQTELLVAFAFLGVDGCVRTLHVSSDHRRLGLGRKAAIKVVNEGLSEFGIPKGERSDVWSCADIANDNAESVSLFKSLGARWIYDSYWIKLDLTKLQVQDSHVSKN